MATLELNGVEIATAQAASAFEDVGERGRTWANDYFVNRAAVKRVAEVETTWLDVQTMLAVVAMVQGRGDVWAFDDVALRSVTTDWDLRCSQVSAKGAPNDAEITTGFEARTGRADEYLAEVGTNYQHPKVRRGFRAATLTRAGKCLAVEDVTTNIFKADIRRATRDSAAIGTNFTAYTSGTVATQTTLYQWATGAGERRAMSWNGASGSGFTTYQNAAALSSYSAGTTHTGSVYLYQSSGSAKSVDVALLDSTGAVTTKSVSLPSGAWTRVEVTRSCAGTYAYLRVINQSGGALTIYGDSFQLEQTAFASSWVDGARTGVPMLGAFLADATSKNSGQYFGCWTRGPANGATGKAYLFYAFDVGYSDYASRSEWVTVYRANGSTALTLEVVDGDESGSSTVTTATTAAGVFTGTNDWKHIAVVLNRATGSATSTATLYVDGVSAATLTYAGHRRPLIYTLLGATVGGASPWNGLIDDFVYLPAAPPASWVASWAAAFLTGDVGWPRTPFLWARGTLWDGASGADASYVPVVGEVSSVTTDRGVSGGTLQAVYKVRFRLTEV